MNKMSKEAFQAMVEQIEHRAKVNVLASQLVADNSNKALDRLATQDPVLAGLLKEGIRLRGENSQRVLDHIAKCKEGR